MHSAGQAYLDARKFLLAGVVARARPGIALCAVRADPALLHRCCWC